MKQPAFTCRECLLQYSFSCLYNQPAVFKERYKLSRTCGFSVRTGPSEQARVRFFPQFKILQHIIGNQSHIGCHIDDIDIIFCTAHNRIIKRLSVYMERTVLSRNFFFIKSSSIFKLPQKLKPGFKLSSTHKLQCAGGKSKLIQFQNKYRKRRMILFIIKVLFYNNISPVIQLL